MAFKYGFYNYDPNDPSSDAKLYDAEEMSRIFDGILVDGVYKYVGSCFKVTPGETANTVHIGTGRSWFNHTWNYNDDIYIMGAPTPPSFNKRIDALVIDVNPIDRHNEFAWVQGEEDENPVKPVYLTSDGHFRHVLAYVTRSANISAISEADIENVVGTDETPYVTGVLETDGVPFFTVNGETIEFHSH